MNPTRADQIGPLDMFKIGVGPSSSHTVGPMVAALEFRNSLDEKLVAKHKEGSLRFEVELYGSLSATGTGHSTDGAVCAGLAGLHPRTAEPDTIWRVMPDLIEKPQLDFKKQIIKFQPKDDIKWLGWTIDDKPLPHPNTIRFRLWDGSKILHEQIFLSVGGGFVEATDAKTGLRKAPKDEGELASVPYPFNSAAEFVEQCTQHDISPWQLVIENEKAKGMDEKTLRSKLKDILAVFEECINNGLAHEGILPGGLNVRRRAKNLHQQMLSGKAVAWSGGDLRPSVYAIAVNEENAAGGPCGDGTDEWVFGTDPGCVADPARNPRVIARDVGEWIDRGVSHRCPRENTCLH